MSLYNMLFGQHEEGSLLVALLNEIQPLDVGRYRDAWVEKQGDVPMIRVHTRNGGGNRECWCEGDEHHCLQAAIESMQAHPWYVRDEDDDFDCTYADFYFQPAGDSSGIWSLVLPALVQLADEPVDMGERWAKMIESIKGERT